MFKKVMVANRGAVASRVIRCLRQLGCRSVAVYSAADQGAPYLDEADERFLIGPPDARASYLNQEALIEVVRRSGADALHPGYGFLAENAAFALRVMGEGCFFIGPQPKWLETMGHKTQARELMRQHGMPMSPGSGVLHEDDANPGRIVAEARRIGFPVLIKPAGGGGGIGMIAASNEEELTKAMARSRALAARTFSIQDVYLEKLLLHPRHVELQVLGDSYGTVRHLYERDCSVQRRNQKVIEEAPAPAVPRPEIEFVATEVVRILNEIGYDNIGTVEMLRGADGTFSFLEMNTRLQVEHAVTEAITGIDLVAAQIKAAAGAPLRDILPERIPFEGHAIEARVYAEDPKRFLPSPGPLERFRPPRIDGVRIETGFAEGMAVTPHYDPLIAKVIARSADRAGALRLLAEALGAFEIRGVRTNIPFLLSTLAHPSFVAGAVHTGLAAAVLAR
ncbi:MAG: biotin carboxylase [Candidatus Lambdaproteobacteria bacterium]|nr:biotin carboxylase [Candidatus Lambdaproteobacteria bacterium]